jgi:integrase
MAAIASISVDLPLPFSPNRIATPAGISSPPSAISWRTTGTVNGHPSRSTSGTAPTRPVADVVRDAGTLHVRRSVTAVRGQMVTNDTGGKTDAARRRIVLGPDLVAVLREHRKRQAAERLAAGPAWRDTGAVFVEVDGRPIHPNKAAASAGLPAIGVHGLRHTHATMLLRGRVPITAVAQRLGHANPSIMLAVYSHALPADDALAADATARALFASA